MHAFAALLTLIRTTMVLVVAGVLAFGALTEPLSAAQPDHQAVMSIDDAPSDDEHQAASCPTGHAPDAHHGGDGTCCVGTCTTILGIAPIAPVPASRISEIEPFHLPILARVSIVEFLRPPSLTV